MFVGDKLFESLLVGVVVGLDSDDEVDNGCKIALDVSIVRRGDFDMTSVTCKINLYSINLTIKIYKVSNV